MRMNDATDRRPVLVQHGVSLCIRRRTKATLDGVPIKVDNDHTFGREFLVRNTTGLNSKHFQRTVYCTDVSKSKQHQPEFGKLHVTIIGGLSDLIVSAHTFLILYGDKLLSRRKGCLTIDKFTCSLVLL